jgi:hypothetical protein
MLRKTAFERIGTGRVGDGHGTKSLSFTATSFTACSPFNKPTVKAVLIFLQLKKKLQIQKQLWNQS